MRLWTLLLALASERFCICTAAELRQGLSRPLKRHVLFVFFHSPRQIHYSGKSAQIPKVRVRFERVSRVRVRVERSRVLSVRGKVRSVRSGAGCGLFGA